MNLDLMTVYAFIRQDLPPGQETIQAIHAAFHAGMKFGAANGVVPGLEFVVSADAPTAKAIRKAQQKLDSAGIKHYVMVDTDISDEVSAVITEPIDEIQKQVLREYRLRKYTRVAEQSVKGQT